MINHKVLVILQGKCDIFICHWMPEPGMYILGTISSPGLSGDSFSYYLLAVYQSEMSFASKKPRALKAIFGSNQYFTHICFLL